MLTRIMVVTLLAGYAHADDECMPVSFLSAHSAVLAPSPITHRVLVRQGNSYTAYELANSPPFSLLRTIPHFEKELSACIPPGSGFGYAGILAIARTPSGGYIFGMAASQQSPPEAEIAVFDAGMHLVSEAPASFRPLAFADLNGDGNPDIIGATYVGHNQALAIALGVGGGGFQPPVLYQVAGQLVFIVGVAVADVNGDHKPDIVIASDTPDSGHVSIFLGTGDGTFQPEKIVANSQGPSVLPALAVADLNRDGHPDIVFTSNNVQTFVSVALGAGDGTFSTPVTYAVADAGAVAIGDLNGDGIPDIVTSGITVLFGDGKGGFSNRRDTLLEPLGNLIVTDFDGDGIADVVTATGVAEVMAGDAVSVLHGLGNGTFAGPQVTLIPNYPAADTLLTALATADVNGDGIPDLASVDNLGHVSVLKGIGDGTLQPAFQFMFGSGVPSGAAFADFNRDGKLDLAVVGSGYTPSSTGEIDIVLGNGDRTFQSPLRIPAPLGAFALAQGDFNGDGNLDLAVLVSQEGAGRSDGVQVLLGNGNGTFTKGALYVAGPYAHSIAAGDFHGNGKLDLVVADAGTYANQNRDGNIALFAGRGDGTFQNPVITSVTGGPVRGPYSLIAADFNRDGKLDLAFTLSDYSNYKGGLMIMLGRGGGTFQPPVNDAVDAVTVQAADLNGDGIVDLIVSGDGVSPGIRYLLGTGDGTFRPAATFNSDFTLYASTPLALADFNRDGRLDIAAIGGAGVVTFLNSMAPAPAFTVVSAAGFTPGPIAAGSIATIFGKNLATTSDVTIEDSTGTTLAASVLFASPSQFNFVVPATLNTGPATVTIGSQTTGVALTPLAPSLFTLNEQGIAAAYVTRVASGGAVTYEPVATLQNGVYAPVPIDVTSGSAYLILFGTGFRDASNVRALVNGSAVEVVYAGPQPSFPGLDQVNLLLPASLSGSGCSNVAVSSGPLGLSSNTVYVCIR